MDRFAIRRRELQRAAFEALEPRTLLARIAVIGDMVDNSRLEDVADMIDTWNVEHIVTVGDNDNLNHIGFDDTAGQYFHDWISPYLGSHGAGSSTGNRFWPAMGNHEWENSNGAKPYTDYFTLPGKERYYNVVLGNIEFFMTDSDTREPDGTSSTSTQGVWLQNALANSTAQWKVVIGHHPPYTSGTEPDGTWFRWPFAQWGADVLLSGHQHQYERLNNNGFPIIVNGPAGGNIGGWGTIDSRSVVRYNGNDGAMRIESSATTLNFKFINRVGTQIDDFTLTKTAPPTGNPITFIPTSSSWKYLDNGSNQGAAWRATSFVDSTWSTGNAELGYGDGDEATLVSYGSNANNKFTTTYFRKGFNVSNASEITSLSLRLKRDDGAVVYLNGTEIDRSNMPTGTIAYNTFADDAIEDESYFTSTLNPALLVSGTNVIAVEVHQSDLTSSDVSFNFELFGTTTGTVPTAPSAPASLSATPASSTQINLSWSDNSSNETGFIVERSLNGSTGWAIIATPSANTTSYSNTGLTPGTQYYYRVRATNAVGDSSNSNTANATTGMPPGSAATYIPTGSIWKFLDNGSNQGTAWRAIAFNDAAWSSGGAELGYGDGDESTTVGFGPSSSNKYVTTYFRKSFTVSNASLVQALQLRLKRDDGAVVYLNGTEIYRSNMPTGTIAYNTYASTAVEENTFYVSSINPALLVSGANVIAVEVHQSDPGSSDVSFDFELTATVSQPPAAPNAPTNLAAAGAGVDRIDLTWLDNATDETGYIIERSANGVDGWTQVGSAGQNATTFSDTTGLSPATTYHYRVRATNGLESGNSNIASAATDAPTPPAAPAQLTASAPAPTQINLEWADNSNNETGFIIERSLDGVGDWALVTTTAANATSYSDASGLSASTQYFYRVRATNVAGDSADSNLATAITPAAPSLPAPWQSRDIGSVSAAGNGVLDGNTYAITGAGADIWNNADGFQFVYQPWTGNGQIIVRVASMQNTNAWAKAGIMFRESLNANAKQASVVVTPTSGLVFLRRTATGGTTAGTFVSGPAAPVYLKLIRNGSTFTAYRSTTGTTWTLVGSAAVSMAQTIYVGMVVSSKSNSLNPSSFTNVTVNSSTATTLNAPVTPPASQSSLVLAQSAQREDLLGLLA